MSADEILLDIEDRMEKAIGVLKQQLSGIRTGRASPGLVDSLKVEAYGSQAALKTLASIGAPEPTQIVIRPFDPSTIKDIERAILASDLGMVPQNDGKVVRLNVPALSTEQRRKYVAVIKERCEECKVSIRNVRRDGNKAADAAQKDKVLTEDDRDQVKKEIQDLTRRFEDQASELAKAREADVMDE